MPLLSKTISTAITMHSFLMGSLKGVWEGQSSRVTVGDGHGECRSQKPTSATASAAQLMETLRPKPPTEESFWPTNRRSTIDRGYDSLTDCFEEALGIEEGETFYSWYYSAHSDSQGPIDIHLHSINHLKSILGPVYVVMLVNFTHNLMAV